MVNGIIALTARSNVLRQWDVSRYHDRLSHSRDRPAHLTPPSMERLVAADNPNGH